MPLAVVLILLAGMIGSAQASEDLAYGAVAFDKAKGFIAFAEHQPSEALALQAVREDCKSSNATCSFEHAFTKQCAAYATSSDGLGFGLTIMATRAKAEEAAMSECKKQGHSGCKVAKLVCAPEGYGG